jgi:uncharacterized RmlC-like cupin family protein
MVTVPIELNSIFQKTHFVNYPFVEIPQMFKDDRGIILNIADGTLGDVAFIESVTNSIRANHYHKTDWHLTYLLSGKMIYRWKENNNLYEETISKGDLIYTPCLIPHQMKFIDDSSFIAVSKNSRVMSNYDSDTVSVIF